MPNPGSLAAALEFETNPDQRCACVLLLDTSGSMEGSRIEGLNEGLQLFKQQLLGDDIAKKRVDLAIITFDSEVNVVRDFGPGETFEIPTLTAQNQTHMGAAITTALEKIEARKQSYKDNGVPYYRPWLFILTDGRPEGEDPSAIEQAKQRLRAAQDSKKIKVFPIAVGDDVDLNELSSFTGTQALHLKGLKFNELFVWLSKSLSVVSHSADTGAQVALPPPDWRTA